MNSRRDTLKVLAASPTAGALLQAQHTHGQDDERTDTKAAYAKSKFFRPAEFTKLTKLCDLIIPRTDTPGALDAGVPMKIDRIASDIPAIAKKLRSGLKQVSGDPLAWLEHASQEKDTRAADFFQLLKSMTIDLYYTSKEGLVTELGWHGNTFLTEFKGCTHPEHQG